jgi:branched-chain amino acid transport system permease protein
MSRIKLPRLTIFAVAFYAVIEILSRVYVGGDAIFNGYIVHIIDQSLIYVIFAVSLNLINGITGQFSLGHMGFAAVGAYISGALTTLIFKVAPTSVGNYALFFVSIIAGGIGAAIVGVLIGFPTLRLKGDYLAIVTLGFGEIIKSILNNIDAVGGPRGLLGIPPFSNFTIIFVVAFLSLVVIRNLVQSSHGRAMLSVRENELAAELVGVDTTKYKVMAFSVGAFFAGVAGALLGHLLQIAVPTQFDFLGSVMVVIMVYAGGAGSLTGSVVAAFVLTFLSEALRIVIDGLANTTGLPIGGEWRMVIYSLLLIFIMLFRTEGLLGTREAKLLIIKEEKE